MATPFLAESDCDSGEDRISELPDDILVTFMLLAGMKDAAKTSIISKRWRYLWANQTDLDFNHLIVLPESNPDPIDYCLYTISEKKKYINWVNQVVGLHCSPYIDTFRVAFNFDGSDGHHIDKWVTFALLKKVQNLQLHLFSELVVYTLSYDVLEPSLGVVDNGINYLTTLNLRNVNVSGDVLEYLLSQCCLLERLDVTHSDTLVRLSVVGLCTKLKQLTICFCRNLEELVIDAVNLVYLKYGSSNSRTNAVFKSMPALDEAEFSGNCFSASSSIFQQISHLAAQITSLYLDVMFSDFPTGVFPTFRNLKQLRMGVGEQIQFDLVSLNQFLKACPTLRELKVEIEWYSDELRGEGYVLWKVDLSRDDVAVVKRYDWEYFERMVEAELERTNLPNLEELKVVGFSGCHADVDLILFVVNLAPNLKTLICDPSRSLAITSEEVAEIRSRADKLVKLIPPKISLVIL